MDVQPACESTRRDIAKRNSLYVLLGKRLFDAVISATGLVFLSPLFLVVALVSKFSSHGPVLYQQKRVGKDGRTFRILKFRTMAVDAERTGPGITAHGDPRITKFGRFLRLLKIDELPQLWNVLKGEMSLVGPRPELPRYVASYTESQRKVLSVRPGITDRASLVYRHEENVLARSPDPERHYRDVVLPHKLQLNIEYLSRVSFSHDLFLICRTLRAIFGSSSEDVASQQP